MAKQKSFTRKTSRTITLKLKHLNNDDIAVKALITAYILLKTSIAREHEVAQAIQNIKGIIEVKVVFGEYDVVAKAQVEDVKMLDDIVTAIRKIDGVATTSTLIAPD